MLFVIDVGNTNMALGVFDGDELVVKGRMTTSHNKTSDEYGMFFMNFFMLHNIEPKEIDAVIISSVVPPIMYSLVHSIESYIRVAPIVVGPGVKTGINLKNENPKEVGADRIVNAVAACERYDSAMILVDFGTATTFDAISPNREYLGGVICPGIKISADALFERASKLPRVELVRTEAIIGKNTIKSIQAGLHYGYVGQVEYIVKKMKKEIAAKYGCDEQTGIKVLATGGLARMVAGETDVIDDVLGNLTLEGLKIIYEMNK